MVLDQRATGPAYDPLSSALRLHRLQQLCQDAGLDSVLLVAGVDGKDNPGATQALRYLFKGVSGRDLLEGTALEPELEDVFVIVKPNGVGVYCTPSYYDALLPYFGLWNNCEIYCATEKDAADPDKMEEYKIFSFVQLIGNDLKTVGVPLMPNFEERKMGDPLSIEQWPLVQAYGLEGVGRSGFFTMNYKVVDVWEPLQRVFADMDAHAVTQRLTHSCRLLREHWANVVKTLSGKTPSDRVHMSERDVGEPLLSYLAYGMLRKVPGVSEAVTMGPRIVFGARTDDDASQSTSTILGKDTLHMVVEAADPKSALRCARTYFFSAGKVVAGGSGLVTSDDLAAGEEGAMVEDEDSVAAAANESSYSSADVRYLMRLYACLVDAGKAAMAHFSSNVKADVRSVRRCVVEAMAASVKEASAAHEAEQAAGTGAPPWPVLDLEKHLRVAMWSCEHSGRINGNPRRGDRQLKVVRVSLHGLKSVDPRRSGSLLGALVYADTFLELEAPEPCLVLTDAVPYLLCWNAAGAEEQRAALVERSIKRLFSNLGEAVLGRPLMEAAEDVLLHGDCDLMPPMEASWYAFESGMAFVSPLLGPMVLDFKRHVERFYLYDRGGGSLSDVSGVGVGGWAGAVDSSAATSGCLVLMVEVKAGTGQRGGGSALLGPWEVLAASHCVAVDLSFLPGATQRHFVRKILPVWQRAWQDQGIDFQSPLGINLAHCVVQRAAATAMARGQVAAARSTVIRAEEVAVAADPTVSSAPKLPIKAFPTLVPDADVSRFLQLLQREDAARRFAAVRRADKGGMLAILAATPPPPKPGGPSDEPSSLMGASSGVGDSIPTSDTLLSPTAPVAASTAPPSPSGPTPVPIVVLCGIPGGGRTKMALDVTRFMASAARWHVIGNDLHEGLSMDLDKLAARLEMVWGVASAADAARADAANGGGAPASASAPPHQVLYLVPGSDDIETVLGRLCGLAPLRERRLVLGAVTACFDAKFFFEDSAAGVGAPRPLPGILQQATLGLVDNIVLQDCDGLPPGAVKTIARLLRVRNPRARVVAASRASQMEYLEDVPRLIEWPGGPDEQLLARHLAASRAPSGEALTAVYLRVRGGVDRRKLRSALGEYMKAGRGGEELTLQTVEVPRPRLYRVKGFLKAGGAALYQVRAYLGKVAISEVQDTTDWPPLVSVPTPLASQVASSEGEGAALLFLGKFLVRGELEALVRKCSAHAPPPLLTRATLGEEVIREIETAHFHDLPEGVFFNGYCYVDFDGTKMDHHPRLEEFIEAYLREKNVEIEAEAGATSSKALVFEQ
eukprot:jgi/Mesvir1/7124/Mv09226-RA.1